MRRLPLIISLLTTLTLLCGCDPRVFDEIGDEATVISMHAEDNYNGAFGKVLTSVSGALSGSIDVTRVVTGAGAGSIQYGFPVWSESELVISGSRKYDICDDSPCSAGVGTSMTGIPVWETSNACVVLPDPSTGITRIACEDSLHVQTQIMPAVGQESIALGASVAGVPDAGNAVGVAFLGAPDGNAGVGELYRLRDGGPGYILVDLAAAMLPANAALGQAIATARLPDDGSFSALDAPVLVVTGAPGAGRVVVAVVGDSDPDPMNATIQADVIGCIDRAEPGFGSVIAAGDLDGDGIPELAISSELNTLSRVDVVQYYDIDALAMGAAVGCDGATTIDPDATLACPSGNLEGVVCGGFGASLAFGDVNSPATGPLTEELLVGAPFSAVDGHARSGAGYLYPHDSLLDGPDLANVDVLFHSNPHDEDQMGTAVAMVGSQLNLMSAGARTEPVLGAPGADAVYVFLCSELAGDTLDNGDLCVASN